ncbi:4-coumarate--CoA ligase 1-like [Vespula maculifrons]|uniref:4-coumarate--CoA ligase 1-like n=1 Tax=Vespula maculifrons TaxID=7453 RepID=A0ABD2CST8_VESMC
MQRLYGMTEMYGSITIQMPYHKLESIGMVSKNVQIKIIDIETENTLRPNKIGELLVTERELSELIAKNITKCNHLRVGVIFLEKMPYTPSEKISRKKLKAITKSHFCK